MSLYQSSSTILLQIQFKRGYATEITLVILSDRLDRYSCAFPIIF